MEKKGEREFDKGERVFGEERTEKQKKKRGKVRVATGNAISVNGTKKRRKKKRGKKEIDPSELRCC